MKHFLSRRNIFQITARFTLIVSWDSLVRILFANLIIGNHKTSSGLPLLRLIWLPNNKLLINNSRSFCFRCHSQFMTVYSTNTGQHYHVWNRLVLCVNRTVWGGKGRGWTAPLFVPRCGLCYSNFSLVAESKNKLESWPTPTFQKGLEKADNTGCIIFSRLHCKSDWGKI